MHERSLTYDVVVVGGGLAGMAAAAAAQGSGARVALLADGSGTLEMASGCIDLCGADSAGEPVGDPWAGLCACAPGHPYALVGQEYVEAALDAFSSICAETGLPYTPPGRGTNQSFVTALGGLRPSYLVPGTVGLPSPGGSVWVAGFRGLQEFHPHVVASGLGKSLPGARVDRSWAELPLGLQGNDGKVHPAALARRLETDAAYRRNFVRSVTLARPGGAAQDLVLVPAVLGLDSPQTVQNELATALGATVGEVPLPPPSLPGLRLAGRWRKYLQRKQVDIVVGSRAVGAVTGGGRVTAVVAQAAAGMVSYRAGAFVLATGGLIGTGLEAQGFSLREPIFGLPVENPDPANARAWAGRQFLPPGGQPFVRSGIRVDSSLRPQGWENLWVCGRMLAGYDPYAERSGGGVAVSSGWKAGLLAGGATL
ncbi:MAG TPA: anaerobic glycerol-3-phosphate dehydrogenase subunit GlpB [Symbiobacteriaceae bacterium]|nr:anaerobic glycerol-3-phosphate dehydrogenase subunit GlpB [Symbiobacteriaceae bacterium]